MFPSSLRSLDRKSKPKLFIVSEFTDGTQNSTGYYWSKIIEGLSEKFNEVYVICPKSSYLKNDKVPDSVTYIFVNDVVFNKKKLITRLFGQISQSLYFTKAIFKNVNENDVIFSGTNPALLLVFMSILKAIKGFKWLLLVHDVFPENLIAAKVIGKQSMLYQLVKYLFDRVYSSPDTLIAIGRDMLDLLSKKTRQQNKIEYVPNWVDPKDIVPLSHESSNPISKSVSTKRIVFQFFGNLGRLQGIHNLLSAISSVKNEKAAFTFIGGGSEEALIINFIKNNPDKDIVHMPSVPFSENNAILSSCDVAVVSLTEGMNGLGVPSKAYFSLGADKPLLVITDDDSELSRLISEEKSIGWFCESGNPAKLAALIDDICNENFYDIRGKPRAVIMKRYRHENAMNQYSKCISELMALQ